MENGLVGMISYHDIIECLSGTLEAKDQYTEGHSSRVADMVCDVCLLLEMKPEAFELTHLAAHMHDIGKIGVPDEILNKVGPLNDREWCYIKQHPTIGYSILRRAQSLQAMATIILHHHERYDGKGYPNRLAGDQIPLSSRVIGLCDAIDAMTSDRPYRQAMSFKVCKERVVEEAGKQFDPQLVKLIEPLWARWETASLGHHRYRDKEHKITMMSGV